MSKINMYNSQELHTHQSNLFGFKIQECLRNVENQLIRAGLSWAH